MKTTRGSAPKPSPLDFFVLVFILTVPFWVLGALSAYQIMPALPISALAVICPLLAAVILAHRQGGRAEVLGLLKRAYDFGRLRSKAWLIPLVLLEPVIKAASYLALRLMGVAVPAPQISLLPALALLALFIVAGLCEELGWSGYVTDPLQERFGALGASLIIGAVWAAWHFIPLLQVQRSWAFIAWWSLETVAMRVIIVWIYNNTGKSVFAAAFYHAMANLTWQLFPVQGSFYDPRVSGPIAALAAVIIIIGWGPRTLTGRKPAGLSQPDRSGSSVS